MAATLRHVRIPAEDPDAVRLRDYPTARYPSEPIGVYAADGGAFDRWYSTVESRASVPLYVAARGYRCANPTCGFLMAPDDRCCPICGETERVR